MSKVYMNGIDISQWQGNFDLTPYKGQFVMIRATYGSKTDSKAIQNMKACERLDIPYGVYCYSYALSVEQAKGEARYLLDVIKGRKISVGVWFDMEDADKYKARHGVFSSTLITAMCNAFCEQIKAAGYYTGIYASRSWFGTKIKDNGRWDKWVADWGTNNGKRTTDTSAIGSIQQYTSRPLDKDVIYAPLSKYGGKDKAKKLVIDGYWGTETTKRTQAFFGTIADGIVSNQPERNKKDLPAATSGWDWQAANFGNGSPMIQKLQKFVGATVDGLMGKQTAAKIQTYFCIKVSGKLDKDTVMAWQRFLNRKA